MEMAIVVGIAIEIATNVSESVHVTEIATEGSVTVNVNASAAIVVTVVTVAIDANATEKDVA